MDTDKNETYNSHGLETQFGNTDHKKNLSLPLKKRINMHDMNGRHDRNEEATRERMTSESVTSVEFYDDGTTTYFWCVDFIFIDILLNNFKYDFLNVNAWNSY